MTLALPPEVAAEAPVGNAPAGPVATSRAIRHQAPARRALLLSSALTVAAIMLLGFVGDVAVLGSVRHSREQEVAFATYRLQLAEGTAPLGALGSDGLLLAMGAPVALLEAPSIGLREVVLEGTTSQVLQSGPGHRRDTVLPGQVGTSLVMGRRAAFGGPFHRLAQLRPGATVTVITGQGRLRFTVRDVRRAGDPQPPSRVAGASRLVLMTAAGAPFVPDGVVRVDADLTSAGLPIPGPRPGITAAEQVLAGDDGSLVPLVLSLQALVLLGVGITWARYRWGRWQAWLVGVPLLCWAGVTAADQAAGLLPNIM